ncbi:MAG: ATP-binding protein [Candidatus Kapaibacteriota bacterium]
MKKFVLTILFLFLVFPTKFLLSDDREVKLDFIKVNGRELTQEELDFLVLSRTDSISFFFHLETKDTSLRTPFIFRVAIKNSKDSSAYPVNLKNINYKNLPEDFYKLSIQAFDPRNNWVAKPLEIEFIVNNKLSSKIREIKKLTPTIQEIDTDLKSENQKRTFYGFELKSLLLGFGVSLLVFLIILTIVIKTKSKAKKTLAESPNKLTIDKQKYEQIVLENSNLRAEIAALRGQIDALNSRAEELRRQNVELKEKVEKLYSSKEELEELQRHKDELFAVIIHDIKNPAALIKNLVELLRSYDLTATEQQEIIDDILQTSNRIIALSQEVSRILALESSLVSLNLEFGNVNEVINEVVKANSRNAQLKNINIFVDIDTKLEEFMFDKYKVYEVLDNLVSNAIKFTQKGGEVQVSSEKKDDKVVIQVIDNGLGLSDEDINRAFQRGARLSAKPTGDEPSSGMGLWIVKRLVQAMRGKVWVKSVLGKGSTFAFSLPFIQDESKKLEKVEEFQEENE